MDLNGIKNISLIGLVLISVITDLKTRKILNIVTYTGMFLGLIFNCVAFYPDILKGLSFSVSGLLLGILIFFLPFSLGGLGAGDLKLLGVIGSFLGLEFVLWTGLASAVAGGVISLILILLDRDGLKNRLIFIKGIYTALVYKTPWPQVQDLKNKKYFPYSLAIIIGLMFCYGYKF